MDAFVKKLPKKDEVSWKDAEGNVVRPSREEAEAAVRTLIRWAGDDPSRAGLIDTPQRVIDAYSEFFVGYSEDPVQVLARQFDEDAGYDDIVMLRDIDINSHCEHHMIPFIGKAHVAYYPTGRVVGISKLARVVEIYARRLQTQETMTAEIANTIDQVLQPQGVAVIIEAVHQCMSLRGIKKPNVATITSKFTGAFKTDPNLQNRFVAFIRDNSQPRF